MWPFPDEQAFRAWAADPDAVLMDQDEDLLLHDPRGLPLLLTAAEDAACPKQHYCAAILQDYSRRITGWQISDAYAALRAAGAHAAASHDPWARTWAEYVTRLFSYLADIRPVNRAEAEQMAADLLNGPTTRLALQLAPGEKHWQCTESGPYPTYLYINRRVGGFRLVTSRPLTKLELTRLRR